MSRKSSVQGAGRWRFSSYRTKGRIYSRARRKRPDGGREQIHLGPIHLATAKIRGCFTVKIMVGRMRNTDKEARVVMMKANLISFWCDALLERNGWKSGNQVFITVGDQDTIGDPVVAVLMGRIEKYNRDQLYLTWKWDGTYGTGRRKRLILNQCASCEQRSKEARMERDIRNGKYLRKGQLQLS